MRTSIYHLLPQNDVSHGVRRCNVVLRWKNLTYTCKYATQSNYWRDFLSAMAESW